MSHDFCWETRVLQLKYQKVPNTDENDIKENSIVLYILEAFFCFVFNKETGVELKT